MDFDPTKIEDELQDLNGNVEALTEVLTAAAACAAKPAAKVEAPVVNVASPTVNTPITVSPQKAVKWVFKVTERDLNGYIKEFTATPQ